MISKIISKILDFKVYEHLIFLDFFLIKFSFQNWRDTLEDTRIFADSNMKPKSIVALQ